MFRPIHINSSQLLCACQGSFKVMGGGGLQQPMYQQKQAYKEKENKKKKVCLNHKFATLKKLLVNLKL